MRFPLPGSFHTSSPNVEMWRFFGKILKRFSVRKAVRVRKEPSFSRKPGPQLSLGAGKDGRQAAGPWGAAEQARQVRSHRPTPQLMKGDFLRQEVRSVRGQGLRQNFEEWFQNEARGAPARLEGLESEG